MQICEVRRGVKYRLCHSHAFGTRATQLSLATPLTETSCTVEITLGSENTNRLQQVLPDAGISLNVESLSN